MKTAKTDDTSTSPKTGFCLPSISGASGVGTSEQSQLGWDIREERESRWGFDLTCFDLIEFELVRVVWFACFVDMNHVDSI